MVSRSKLEVSERVNWWKNSRSSSGIRFSVSFFISGPEGVESILSHRDEIASKRDEPEIRLE
jgi:hypothetical protein